MKTKVIIAAITIAFSVTMGTMSMVYEEKAEKSEELISAQRTLIDSQREYISTAYEVYIRSFVEFQNQMIEECRSGSFQR